MLILSFLKRDVTNSFRSLMSKEQQEWFAQVAHDKRATLSNSLTSLFTKERQERITLFHSFAHKKRANRSKKRWANSQPCRLRLNSWEQQTFVFMKCTPKQQGQNTFLSNNILVLCHRPILIEVTLFRNFFNIIIYPPLDYQKENQTSA